MITLMRWVCEYHYLVIIMASLQSLRATALSVYQWGVYIGYSLAFLFDLLVVHIGWRWVYRIAAFPGVTVAMVLLVTVKEPARQVQV